MALNCLDLESTWLPLALEARRLRWWAGPWPVDERWWDPEPSRTGRTARAQVLLDESQALLLCYRQRRWYVEGSYE